MPLAPFVVKQAATFPRRTKRFLHDIFGLVPIAHHSIGHAIQHRSVIITQR